MDANKHFSKPDSDEPLDFSKFLQSMTDLQGKQHTCEMCTDEPSTLTDIAEANALIDKLRKANREGRAMSTSMVTRLHSSIGELSEKLAETERQLDVYDAMVNGINNTISMANLAFEQ